MKNIILTTTENVNDKKYEIVDICTGSAVMSSNVVADYTQGLKSIFGGELKKYTKVMNDAREEATNRIIEDAKEKGCDAVVSIRFFTSQMLETASEITIYGTGVRFI